MKIIFNILNRIEMLAAFMQGKGYGSSTIKQEVSVISHFFDDAPKLAIDIGGNIGDYSSSLRLRFPNLELHIFEPSAINIGLLNSRFGMDHLIKIIPCAVSNVEGFATLYSDEPGSGLSSLVRRNIDHFGIELAVSEPISTIRFEDYWVDSLGCRPIDFIKMDIEGFEFMALEGLGESLKNTKIIQFEFGGTNIDTKTYFQDFWYFFQKNNFTLFRITPFGPERIFKYKESDEFFLTTNYFAVNRNW